MPFALREYDPADFETLWAIDQACYPRGIAYSRRMLRGFLMQSDADCIVAESSGPAGSRIAGFLIADAEGEDGHIITIDVIEPERRAGVGSALLRKMEERLAQRGVRRVSLETATANEAGVAFWGRHGYRNADVIRDYYGRHGDAYSMTKELAQRQRISGPE